MFPSTSELPSDLAKKLADFRLYLTVRRDRTQATADAYIHDSMTYIRYFAEKIDDSLEAFTITPEHVLGFSDWLKQKKLSRATIERRLIGLNRFWKFLYRMKHVAHPPVALDDLDIMIKKARNATQPLCQDDFTHIRKVIKSELANIR